MLRKPPSPLPDGLRYLQAFVTSLAKLPPEDLNEDIDPTRLESAVRKRLRGLDEDSAEAQLAKDRELLARWLKDKPNHPAHWVHGFLLSPDLASRLTRPTEAPPRGPVISFDVPNGWKVKKVPFRLDLKAGKVIGSITAIDEPTFNLFRYQREQTGKIQRPPVQETTEVLDVSFQECRGKKYLYRMTAPAPWKTVDCVLSVPGGFVDISLGTMTGADFNESPLESKLHTLQLSASA